MRITEKLLLFLWTSVISSSLQVSFTIFKNILRICYKPTCFSFGKIGLYLDVYHSGVFFFKLLYTCIIEHETYGTSWMKTTLVNNSKTIHEIILLNSVSFPQKLLSVVLTTCNFLCVSLKVCANYPLNTNKVLSNYRCYSNFWNVGSIVWSKKKKCLRNFKVGQGRNRFL